MRIGLTQSALGAPYQVSAIPLAHPAAGEAEVREQIRQRVLAERGVDGLSLYRLSSQDRIRTESAVAAETALRTRIAQRQGLANVVDMKA